MERAVATFPSIDTLVVTGESAGGFGAVTNYDFIRTHWGDQNLKHGVLIDDSGPVTDDKTIAPCLQESWRATWNLNASMPPDCPCVGKAGNIVSIWAYLMKKYPNDSFGLISSTQDAVISTFFSFGMHNCMSPFPDPRYDALAAGLLSLSASGVPVYMIPGVVHTHTGGKASFYTEQVDGIELYKWVAQLVSNDVPNPPSVIPKGNGSGSLTVAFS